MSRALPEPEEGFFLEQERDERDKILLKVTKEISIDGLVSTMGGEGGGKGKSREYFACGRGNVSLVGKSPSLIIGEFLLVKSIIWKSKWVKKLIKYNHPDLYGQM
jgi:hypothetical protein